MVQNADGDSIPGFVEEVGLYFGAAGLPRMAGRVLGWLLVSDPPYQSADELAEALQASKGSISTTTRLLIQAGFIQRFSRPGHRRDYFQIGLGTWSRLLNGEIKTLATLTQLTERGLRLLDGAPPHQRQRLEEMRDFSRWFERKLPDLIAQWEQERRQMQESWEAEPGATAHAVRGDGR